MADAQGGAGTARPKTPDEIAKMRVAGRLAASVLEMIGDHVRPGVSTEELDRICHDYIVDEIDCIPAPLNYGGRGQPPFPKSICTSVNHVVCHGIPSPKKVLKAGDVMNIDVTVIKDGYHGDTSKMFMVGEPSVLARRLSEVTQQCLYAGIRAIRPGAQWATSATPSRSLRMPTASPWSASSAAMGSATCSTTTRRSCTTAALAPAWHFAKA